MIDPKIKSLLIFFLEEIVLELIKHVIKTISDFKFLILLIFLKNKLNIISSIILINHFINFKNKFID